MTSFWIALIFCLFAAAAPLGAQDAPKGPPAQASPAAPEPVPPPPPAKTYPPDIPMEAYGTANPDCMEWTDECRTCLRDAQNRIACSTPGIACLPGDISCKAPRK
jgi:hypothetical protein